MEASKELSSAPISTTDLLVEDHYTQDSGITDIPTQPEDGVLLDVRIVPNISIIKEMRVKQYDPKKIFGPFTPAQMSLYESLLKIIPDGYPSKASLSTARAREICYMGSRALKAIPHIPAMTPTEIL